MDFKKEDWELLFNSIDEGFCIIEMIFNEQKKPVDYRFLVINASFERQTGLTNAIGKRMREFAPNHEDHWFETYGKIALTGESIRFENRAEQLQRWYDVYAFRFGEPGDFQVAILFNDITERKRSADTIKSLNSELADKVKQLEFTNKELEAFSYSVSHDLRAPLRAINSYARVLSEDFSENLNPEMNKNIEVICRNAEKMGNLIDDLLAFSRLSKNEVIKYRIDLKTMVKNIIEEVSTHYSIDKKVFHLKELVPASGDIAMIKQMWMNLISNACKYSKNNPDMSIEVGSLKNKDEVIYYVKDNGVGFDMRYSNKLFGIFQRLHSDSEFEGTGVGLAIVHRIVTKHEGRIWAEGKLNEGASFYFTLP